MYLIRSNKEVLVKLYIKTTKVKNKNQLIYIIYPLK